MNHRVFLRGCLAALPFALIACQSPEPFFVELSEQPNFTASKPFAPLPNAQAPDGNSGSNVAATTPAHGIQPEHNHPAPAVSVPSLIAAAPMAETTTNATCPIMGKPVSSELFVDTSMGRFFVCCKPCIKKILDDVDAAHRTAYAESTVHDNKTCPVMGEPIIDTDLRVTLQGHDFGICCVDCFDRAAADHQVTLARLHNPKLRDGKNTVCPITGDAVVPHAFVVLDGVIVRLSSMECVDAARAQPQAVLARVAELGGDS